MHIYPWQTDPTPFLQSSIDVCKTITPNKFYIEKNAHIPLADGPPQLTRDPCYTVTSKKFHILQNVHIPMTDWPLCQSTLHPCYTITPPLPIDHGSMLHSYISPSLLTIDLCYTVTPHKSHIVHNAHIPKADPYTKAVSHIVECHGRLIPPPPPIEHRSLENHYTK